MTSKEYIEVSAGIIRRKGLILVAQIPENKPFAGYWEFPGGKNDGNETPEQTLKRELAEELGIKVTTIERLKTIVHEYEDYTVRLTFFLVTAYEGFPSPLEDQNTRWIKPTELDELQFLPADSEILEFVKDLEEKPAS